jgi:hypothetical protein
MDGSEDSAIEMCAKDDASFTLCWRHWHGRPLLNVRALCNTPSLSIKRLPQLILSLFCALSSPEF